jgi:mono/diheme cytochrome c family protein
MTAEESHMTDTSTPRSRIDIFVDDGAEPLLSATPPLSFELNTSSLADGPHVMRIEAYDAHGVKGIRRVDFSVRNGPGIAVSGIQQDDVLDGKIPVIVNAYGGTSAVDWEPSQAETPAPPPTWAWVSLILFVAFGLFYGVQHWSPTTDFTRTPTYGAFGGSESTSPAEAATAAAVPARVAAPVDPPAGAEASLTRLSAADAARGAALYSANCAACHQPTGQGLGGVFPPLAGAAVVNATDPTEHIVTVLDGRLGSTIGGVTYASPMPAFKKILNDLDLAAIVNHERTSWGNAAPIVSTSDVAKLRK